MLQRTRNLSLIKSVRREGGSFFVNRTIPVVLVVSRAWYETEGSWIFLLCLFFFFSLYVSLTERCVGGLLKEVPSRTLAQKWVSQWRSSGVNPYILMIIMLNLFSSRKTHCTRTANIHSSGIYVYCSNERSSSMHLAMGRALWEKMMATLLYSFVKPGETLEDEWSSFLVIFCAVESKMF